MCGIVGIYASSPVNQGLYDALTVLQHRGQDAAGIVTEKEGKMYLRKANGLVKDVFHTRHMRRLQGNIGVGHVRYPTAGCASSAEAQPLYVNSPYGIVLAHNGNLTNQEQLKKELYRTDRRHINTSSDSEILLNVFAHELQKTSQDKLTPEVIFNAIKKVYQRCKGGFAAVALITGHGMVCFRDPNGIRPIVFGKRETGGKTEYMVASESVALDTLEFDLVRDVNPGEAIYIDENGELHTEQCTEAHELSPCIFEHVYLARPDSIMDDVSVYRARLRMGEKLADKIMRVWPDHDIDVVIPIPDTSTTSAIELASNLNVKLRHGFVKNRYIGRTFIMPGQQMRKKSVKQKLNAIGLEFKGKNVLLMDDSIVRGTTSQQIVEMAREAGAKKVYFASAAPAVRYPNVYGIDMPSAKELIAHDRTEKEVEQLIGADKLIYQDLEDLVETCREGNPKINRFDTSVFDGQYITGDIDGAYLEALDNKRNDLAKNSSGIEKVDDDMDQSDDSIIGLHNVGGA
ncbi:amidophosphoribosyltransferase [Aliikangiella coralliicola]|uniref:Amidophosphoribosyltransferase n=1 Tax=Aliikangiella coralliicola TaxID=2592383 RepID=A0A545UD03_9GAMM|nr:amidophosphoribosyltransferase [Aliikangiella coralliicola]TQV87338.1 amidophosphoribosyltransferase [Aliikangiella coralliicola]